MNATDALQLQWNVFLVNCYQCELELNLLFARHELETRMLLVELRNAMGRNAVRMARPPPQRGQLRWTGQGCPEMRVPITAWRT